jgi:hypothetical protein
MRPFVVEMVPPQKEPIKKELSLQRQNKIHIFAASISETAPG